MKQSKSMNWFAVLTTALLMWVPGLMLSQTYTMPGNGTTGSNSISACSGTVYDPGGTSTYANNTYSTLTICPSTPGQVVQLTFTAFNTESGFDYLDVYIGNSTAGTYYGGYTGNGGGPSAAIVSTSSDGCITLVFSSDGSTVKAGFAATISCVTPPPPPANDNCPGAIALSSGATCTYTSGTVLNASQSLAGCSGTADDDVWYSFTPTTSGQNITVSPGSSFDPVVQVFSGSCASLSSINCNDASYPYGSSGTNTLSGLTPGQTYYIRIYDYYSSATTTPTFSICAQSYSPPPPTNQDCMDAIPVCQSSYSQTNSYSGTGSVAGEINSSSSCLLSGEKNDVWYQFTVQSSGSLCFMINPNSATDDYDWGIYNLTNNNCSDIYSNASLEVGCDYSGQTTYYATGSEHPSWAGPSGDGNTGMVPTPDASDSQVNPCITVSTGQTFVLNISNFSSSQNGYTLYFPPPGTAGMAQIYDNIPPQINSLTATPTCGATSFSFNMSENILCSTVSTGDFTLSGPGGTYTVTSISGSGCSAGAPSENTFTVTVSPAITTSGTYSLCLGTAAGSVTDLCGNVAPAGCFTFTIAGPSITASHTNPSCSTGTGSITAVGSGGSGSPYTYSINGGAFQSSGTFSGLGAGTYTITTKDGGGCQAQTTQVITIPPPLTATLTPTAATCTTGGSISTSVTGGTTPYSYSWSPSGTGANPSGLAAGNYSVTITSANGCTVTATTTITSTGTVTATFTNSPNQCLNTNSFTFTNTGSSAGQSWTFPGGTPGTSTLTSVSGVTWSTAGTYTVTHTVTSGTCTATNTVQVTVFPRPSGPGLTPTNPTCGNSNGSITVAAATGGTPAYLYNLNGGSNSALTNYTNQGPGTYTVNVTDANGCTNSSTVTLTNIPGPTAVATTTVTAHCGQSDGSITIGAVTGGTPAYTYSVTPTVGFSGSTSYTAQASGTHTITVKDANNCTYTTTVNVPNAAGPTGPNATSTNSTCGASNGTVTLAPPTTGSGPFTYSFNGGAFSTTTSYTGLAANTYTYIVKDAFGCTVNGSITVNNSPGPTAVVLTPTNATCGSSNGSFTIGAVTGGTSAYTYSVSPGPAGFNATTSFTSLLAGTYTVIVKDANGCTYTSNTTINNSGGPTAVVLTPVNSNCGAANGSFTIGAVTGGVAAYTYSVNGGVYSGTTSYTGLAAGTYTVSVKDANGCTYSSTTIVGNNPGPTALALTPVNATCGNANGSFTIGAVTGGTSAYTYSVSPGPAGFNGTTSFTSLAANTYTVTVKDANGCTFTSNTTVNNVPGPTAVALTPSNSTCGASNGAFTIGAVTGGTSAYTYSVSPGPAGFTGTTSYSGLAAGTYTVIVKDANGCTFTSNTTISNTPGPTAVSLTPANTSCGGATGSLTIGAVTGGTSAYTYSVSPGPAGFNATTSFTSLTAATYTVIVKDANGCTFTATSVVGNNPGPTAVALTPTNSTCGASNGSFNIGAVTGGTAAYTYSVNGSAFTGTTSYTGLAAGTYSVTVKDANGCTFSTTTTISNSGGPSAVVLTPVDATCGANNGSFTIGAVTGGASPYTYSVNGGAYSGTTSYTNLAAGTYSVSVKDNNGCIFSTTTSISNSGGPTAQAMSSTNSACSSNTGTVTFGATTGGTGIITYSFNGGAFSSTTVYNNIAAGTYNATVQDGNGCQYSTTVTVGTVAGPTDVALTPANSTCGNSNGTITVGAVTGGTAAYTYSLDGGASSGTTSYTGLAAGTHTILVTDNNGCTYSETVNVSNTPGPTAFAVSSTSSTCGNSNGTATAGAVTTSGSTSFQYSINGGALGSTTTFTGLAAATYTLLVQDANGCTFTNTVTVTDLPGPTAQALTPTNSTCGNANGSVVIGATTGGNGAITYSFNGGAFSGTTTYTGLAAGTYTVIAQDANNCQFTQTTVVSDSPGPTAVVLTPSSATCGGSNGAITVGAVTGGAGSNTFSLNGGPFSGTTSYTGLTAGSYTIDVLDANSCPYSQTVAVINSGGPTAAPLTPTNTTCGNANGSIAVGAVTGGSGTISYAINGGAYSSTSTFTGLSAGSYTIDVKDANGCILSQTISLSDTPGPTAIAMTPINSTCGNSNGSFTIDGVTGGTSGYTYSVNAAAFSGTTSYTNLIAGTYTVVVKDANNCQFTQNVVVGNTAGPTNAALTSVNSTCGNNNGQVNVGTVTTTGSTTFQYSIDGGALQSGTNFSGLSAATHTVLVQDANGCQYTGTINVADTPGPTAQAVTTTNSTCGNANGVISIGATTGGTAAYQYSIDGTTFSAATSYTVAAGTYTVTVKDANLCTYTVTTIVNNTAGPTAVSLTSIGSNCGNANGSVTVGVVTGGTAAYQYDINGGAQQASTIFPGLLAGTYTVNVTDANLCTISNTVVVNNLGSPTAIVASQTNVSCNGGNNGSVTITASGGAGSFSYQLNTGQTNGSGVFSNLIAGSYTVTVTDIASCSTTTTFTIGQPAQLIGTIASQTPTSCFGGSDGTVTIDQSGGTSPFQYSINGGAFGSSANFTGLAANGYTVAVKDANGCLSNVSITITQPSQVTLAFSSTNANCTDSNGSASVTATGGASGYSYLWTGGGGTNPTTIPLAAGTYSVTVTDANGCVANGNTTIGVTPGGTASISNTINVTCNGANNGSLTVSMNGGATSPFNYFWTGTSGSGATVTGLAPGTYSVTVIDAHGCTATTSGTISEPIALSLTFLSTNVSCNGGSDGAVNSNVTGGTAPYSYSWSPGAFNTANISNLPASTYSLTVTDANGCQVSGTRTVTEPTALTITPTINNPHCGQADGSATVTGSGGAGGYTFSLNGGTFGAGSFNSLSATTYTVTIKDANNCTANLPLTLVDQSGPTATITSSTNVSCNGGNNGQATVAASGGQSPYTYLWTPSAQTTQTASNLSAGVYGVVVTDASGCSASASIIIAEPSVLTINASGADPVCNGQSNGTGSVSAFGGTAPYAYQWAVIPIQTTANAINLPAGTYSVTVTDANGCNQTTSITLTNPPLLTVSITTTSVTCNAACNGTAIANTTNGNSPFGFTWSDANAQTTQTASGLCAGAYTVNVVDFKGCTATATTTITEPPVLTSTIINPVDVRCSGDCNGSGGVSPSGGVTPYSYSWTNTSATTSVLSSLCAGTYVATVTDANGCTSQSTLTIGTPNPIVLTASTLNNASCYGVCDGAATAALSGGTAPYSFQWTPSTQQQINASGLCAGVHTVTVTDVNGCQSSATTTITQPTQLTAIATGTGSSFCGQNNGSALVQVSGGTSPFNYVWNNGGTTAFISNLGGGVYSVDITDANGCTVNAVANVNDIPAPTIVLNSSTDITCYGLNNGTAVVTTSGGTAPYSPTWLLPVTLTSNPDQTGNGLWPGNNVYQVVDAAGCISSITVPIIEPTQLVAAISNPATNVSCNGGNDGNATMLANGGTPNYTYLWTDPSAQITATANTLSAGTYSCTVTDANGCVVTKTVTIIEPLPIVITTNSIIQIDCYGAQDGSVNISVTGGSPAYTYNWTPATGGSNVITNLSPGQYHIQIQDTHGCTADNDYTITQPDSMSVSITQTPSHCTQANGSITLGVSGAVAPYTYNWNTSPTQTAATAGNLLGPGAYSCLITDNNGCTKNVPVTLSDIPPPTIDSVGVSNILCYGDSTGVLTVYPKAGGSGNFTYEWYTSTTLVGTSQIANHLGVGNYIVTVHEGDCEVTGIGSISQPFPLLLSVSADQTVCNGQTIGLSATAGNGTPGYTYSWTENDSLLSFTTGGNHNVTFTNNTASTEFNYFDISVNDANNCGPVVKTITITVLPKITPMAPSVTGCLGEDVTLTASATGGQGSPYIYTWGVVPQIPPETTVVSQVTVPVTSLDPVVYTISVSDGCSTPVTIKDTVFANPKPSASLIGVNTQGCSVLNTSFAGNGGASGDPNFFGCTYAWSFGDGSVGTDSVVTHSYTNQGSSVDSLDVQLIVTTQKGCSDTAIINNYVLVYPNPVAEFTYDPSNPTESNPILNFINESQVNASNFWDFGEFASSSNTSTDENPTHAYQSAGTYTVMLAVISDRGCTDTTYHEIYIEPEFAIYVPNAFSPNQDIHNETFYPQGIGISTEKYHMYIFDRWGELIFESSDLDKGWDGTANGKSTIVQQDVYIYKIQCYDLLGNKHSLTGHVTVVR